MPEIPRLIENKVVASLEAFSLVYLVGARQSGKSTLAENIITSRHPAQYITFDDLQARSAAQHDPTAFLESFSGPVVLDEIQLVPELFRPLKIRVDKLRRMKGGGNGRFLLTGSASIMSLPALSDALVGRMVLHTLYPISAHELSPVGKTFIDRIFSSDWGFEKVQHNDFMNIMMNTSYPELLKITNHDLRYQWCNGYLETILQRDLRSIQEISKIDSIARLLRLIASRTGGLLNEATLSRDTELNHLTLKKYRLLLEGLFLIQSIPAWSTNLGKRLIKSPKTYLGDLSLLCYLLNVTLEQVYSSDRTLFGQIFENYIAIELNKQLTFCDAHANLYHYRSASGHEVDFILEGPAHKIVALEVKAKTKLTDQDFKQLVTLKNELGNQFQRGFVVYLGDEIVAFANDLWAVPVSCM